MTLFQMSTCLYFLLTHCDDAYIDNYLVIGKLLHHLSPREWRNIIQQSAQYPWVGGYLFYIESYLEIQCCVREDEIHGLLKTFITSLVEVTWLIRGPYIKYFAWDTASPFYSRIPKSMYKGVTTIKE